MLAGVEIISIVDGIRRDARIVADVAVVQPRSLFGLKGDHSRLFILTSPPYHDASDANQMAISAISSTYLRESSRSVTSRLSSALREANRCLCDDNSKTIPSEHHLLSALCAVVGPDDAYFAQVGPSIIALIRNGELQRLGEKASSALSTGCIGRDFAFEVHYAHTSVEPGDIIILASPGLAKITNRERLLSCLAEGPGEPISDRMHRLYEDAPTHADFSAISIDFRGVQVKQSIPSRRERAAVRQSQSTSNSGARQQPASFPEDSRVSSPGTRPRSQESLPSLENRELLVPPFLRNRAGSKDLHDGPSTGNPPPRQRPSEAEPGDEMPPWAKRVHDARLGGQPGDPRPVGKAQYAVNAQPTHSAKASPLTAEEELPLPVRDVVIQFKGSRAGGALIAQAMTHPIGGDAIGDRAALAAQASISALADYLVSAARAASALALPIAVLGVLVAVGLIFLSGYQIQERQQTRSALDEALQLEQDALATTDPSLKRRLLARADQMASSAQARSGDNAVLSTNTRIRDELDRLSAVTKLSSPNVLVDLSREAASAESLVMQMQGIDVFLLDRDRDRVYKYQLDGTGNSVQSAGNPVIMRKGDTIGRAVIGDLVGMTWIPSGGARLRGGLVALDSAGAAFEYDAERGLSTTRIPTGDYLTRPFAVVGYAGNLYVLDPHKGTLQWYSPSSAGYGDTSYSYFNPEARVDLSTAIDLAFDGNLYLLHRDGRIQKFAAGRPQPFDPVLPDLPLKAPTSVFSSPDSHFVYVVDAGNSRVVQFTREGAFERQLQYSAQQDILRSTRAVSIDENKGILYALSGKKVLSFALEPREK